MKNVRPTYTQVDDIVTNYYDICILNRFYKKNGLHGRYDVRRIDAPKFSDRRKINIYLSVTTKRWIVR